MATYKKRGYKVNTKPEKPEVDDQEQDLDAIENSTTAEVFETLDETANKAEEWVVANQKAIYSVIAVLVVVILGFVGYNYKTSNITVLGCNDTLNVCTNMSWYLYDNSYMNYINNSTPMQ